METDRGPRGDEAETPGSWSENPIWRLYTAYGTGRRYAVLGAAATVVGRAFGLVPAFVIGLAVDAIFLAERPYELPLVPEGLVPGTDVEQLYFSIA
ncbi:MAG TPA: ABC transporter ATP-binding protein, partial [Natronoarchaeum rubrum]|nr:ABC transporter ATP-binding protein [Natronoarchaeum rubrum]